MKHQYRLAVLGAIIVTLSGCSLFVPATNPVPVPATTSPAETVPPAGSSGTVPADSGSPQPSVPAPDCPPGISLPDGVDAHWVCGPAPTSMKILPTFIAGASAANPDPTEWSAFKTPDGNVVCSWYDASTLTCRANVMNVPLPHDPVTDYPEQVTNCSRGLEVRDTHAGKACNGGVLMLDYIMNDPDVPVLENGYSVRSVDYPYPWSEKDRPKDTVACITEPDGVTCWNTTTSHGIKIGKNIATFW